MLPRSSSSNSQRRSSILKPPKTRLPFQDLDFNTSSPENSPDTTKKRRVSFAEKKHVKEFCDHKEQGTIWDSTYEEPDQNISKSTDSTNENVDILVDESGFNIQRDNEDLKNSKTYVNMDENSVENTSKKIFINSGTELEFTDVIVPCSRGISNDSMSRTIFCQDDDLEITAVNGGIEPTVSVKTITNFHFPREIRDSDGLDQGTKDTEKTVVFDQSGDDMNFTEVISRRNIPITKNLDIYKDPENGNSLIENQTIIFEDSIMDLTLTKSQTDIEINFPQSDRNDVGKENIRLCDNSDVTKDCVDPQASNKTVIFSDFGCDMTEAINTVLHQVPEVNLVKEIVETAENHSVETSAVPQRDINSAITGQENNLSNRSDSTLVISDGNSNKTILFNDFGCEMTEAIDTLKPGPVQNEIIDDTNSAEQTVPQQLIEINEITNVQMKIESLSSKTDPESSPKLISKCNNRTEFFDDSAMDFTTAITREKAVEIKVVENNTVDRNKTEIFHNCDAEITEDVQATVYSLNSRANLEERANLSSTEFESGEVQSNKKRKSYEIEAITDYNKLSHSLMSKSSGHDLVQSLVHDKSVHVTNDYSDQNCKRLKIADVNAKEVCSTVEDDFETLQSESLDDIANRTDNISSTNSQDIPEMQIEISPDVEAAKDCVDSLAGKGVKSTEDAFVIATSNCSNDQEKSMIDDDVKPEAKESQDTLTEDDVSEEESFFMEATLGHSYSDSGFEIQELSRVYDKQQQSLIEKSNDTRSRLNPTKCLDNNDNCCFVMFSEELEKHAKSENCIWTIRSLNEKKVLIDFISKSLVVVIHLEPSEELTTPSLIKDIQFISLLADSECGDISMIHNIILKKLDPYELKRLHKTTQDVLPLLNIISDRVKLLLDFMYEYDKLQDLNQINRSGNRISFRLYSYKVQLVIKITVNLEPFEDIGPNDVTVECVLGNIRKKDIQQLIASVKKDHKFLTNYINDIKEYIALVVEK